VKKEKRKNIIIQRKIRKEKKMVKRKNIIIQGRIKKEKKMVKRKNVNINIGRIKILLNLQLLVKKMLLLHLVKKRM